MHWIPIRTALRQISSRKCKMEEVIKKIGKSLKAGNGATVIDRGRPL